MSGSRLGRRLESCGKDGVAVAADTARTLARDVEALSEVPGLNWVEQRREEPLKMMWYLLENKAGKS